MRSKLLISTLALVFVLPAAPGSARSSIRVGIGDQSPRMFESPHFQQLKIKRTRYFVPADIMQDRAERLKARTFVKAARKAKVSTLLHISTADLRPKRGKLVSTRSYRRNVGRIVAYFRKLGVRDFGAWNEANHKTQETWNRVGHAASYFKSMYRTVKRRCRSCAVVGLDVLDQKGVERYIRAFYKRLSPTWRKRLTVIGIHNYSDVNRNRSRGTAKIIRTVRRHNRRARFWFTETGALASFGRSFRYSENRQARRIRTMFSLASRFRTRGVERVYSYNFFGIEDGGCGSRCRFDAGLVDADGSPRRVLDVFESRARRYRR